MQATLIATLLALLVPTTNHKNAETDTEASARYAVIAEAIADETVDDEPLALFLLTVAKFESTLRLDVHAGDVRGDNGFAWSLFQLNVGSRDAATVIPRTEITLGEIVGVDIASTRRATHVAALYLRRSIKRCNGEPRCVFAGYGGLSKHEASKPKRRAQLDARVATFRRLSTNK
jgi:hypothetical protein